MFRTICAAAALFCGVQAHAATLVLDGTGQLTGARGVVSNGTSYDVDFRTGACSALFNGCDDPSDFIFNADSAADFAQALLDQVFIDGPDGPFDSRPFLTGRVKASLIPYEAERVGPYHVVARSYYAQNWPGANEDKVGTIIAYSFENIKKDLSYAVVAKSEVQPSPVPLPAGALLMLSGLVGLGFLRRRT